MVLRPCLYTTAAASLMYIITENSVQVVMGNILPSSKCHGVNESIKT